MRDKSCGVCNKEVPINHAQLARREENGSITVYHMGCESSDLKPCEDCGEHRLFCADCAE